MTTWCDTKTAVQAVTSGDRLYLHGMCTTPTPLIEALVARGEELRDVELWQSWFNTVRQINFRPEPGAGAQTGEDLIYLWQDSARKMIDTQADLVRRWTRGVTGTKKQGQTSGQ